MSRNSLGRNLSVLLRNSHSGLFLEEPARKSMSLALASLEPGKYQPRTEIDTTPLAELAASIKQQGLLQPLIVRQLAPNRYEIIAGERRWRACQLAGLTEAPVILHQVDDQTAMAIALVENLQREELNAIDQARAMQRLINEFALTHQQVAELLSKSRTAVSNLLRLLSLSDPVRHLLEQGILDMGHARALLVLEEAQQAQVAQLVVAKKLSVRETEQLVTRLKSDKPEVTAKKELSPLLKEQAQLLGECLNTKINIKPGKTGRGTLVIHYDSVQDLQKVIQQIIGKRY